MYNKLSYLVHLGIVVLVPNVPDKDSYFYEGNQCYFRLVFDIYSQLTPPTSSFFALSSIVGSSLLGANFGQTVG